MDCQVMFSGSVPLGVIRKLSEPLNLVSHRMLTLPQEPRFMPVATRRLLAFTMSDAFSLSGPEKVAAPLVVMISRS